MASPAWHPQEMQSSSSQTSVMSSVTGGPTPGSSTTNSGSPQEAAQEKIIPPPDYNVIGSISPGSSASLQPPVPGKSASVGPSFSYNISKADNSFSSGIQFSSNKLKAPEHAVDGKNSPSPAASLQPPLPLVSTRLSSFTPGTTAPSAPPISASNLSFKGNLQMVQTNQIMTPNTRVDVAQEMGAMTSAPSVMQPFSQAAYMNSGSSTTAFPTYVGTSTVRMPHAPQFQVPVGVPKSPVTPGPPGLRPAIPSSSNLTATASSGGSSLSFRPNVPPAPIPANPHVQQQAYSPHFPATLVVPSNQGLWLQPAPVTTMLRPPFSSYPAPFTAPFPLSATGAPLPSVMLPDPQPPGVTSVTAPPGVATTVSQSPGSGLQPELLPGVDSGKHVNAFDRKEGASTIEQRDTWTAHRTETGAIYYYNSLTGESTYEKPAGFMGEPGNVAVQPAPVSWEKLSCTDWALVTTNDGQKYYYNTRTKVSSWQIPSEVTEFKKKHDADALQAQSMSVPNANALTEKGSAPLSLSIPAVNTGGRDATTLRASVVPGSSALDLVKKKLMDSGAPAVVASPTPALSGALSSEANGTKALESTVRAPQRENSRENDNSSESSSDSEDGESVPTKDDCIIQFKVMLKERGVAPFSKWERELPKILFDPRFKAVPSYSTRKALFEHYVKTRADEERKEKRAAQKAAVEGFKQLLEEAKEDINQDTDYQSFKKKWGHDPRFELLDRKERESLLNERVHQLRKEAQEKTQALRTASISQFKSMLRERGDITLDTRWSKVKDSLRNDPRYKSVKHEDKEALFNEYLSELKAAEQEVARIAKAKYDEEEKLRERERALRKRKEREEQEVERVRLKARRKEAVESYQALLVEIIKDPQASWTESKPKLEKDPQGRAANPHLDQSDLEKLFREHVKILYERSAQEFKALLAEVITAEACTRETEGGKTVVNSWSTAKQVLKADPRCSKVPRKDRESLWRRHVDDIQRRQKLVLGEGDKPRSKSSADSRRR